MSDLREAIAAELLRQATDPRTTTFKERSDSLLTLLSEHGLVELDENQELPETAIDELEYSTVVCRNFRWGVEARTKDMLKAGWRKVKEIA